MFDLDAGINFNEVELVVLINNEFNGSGIGIVGMLDHPDSCLAHVLARFFRQVWSRAFFDQFLVTALRATVAFPEVDNISMMVCQDLDFYMPGPFNVFFQVDVWISKGGFCLGPGPAGSQCSRPVRWLPPACLFHPLRQLP